MDKNEAQNIRSIILKWIENIGEQMRRMKQEESLRKRISKIENLSGVGIVDKKTKIRSDLLVQSKWNRVIISDHIN